MKKHFRKPHTILLLILLLFATIGSANTLRVALDGTQPYASIQTAINASANTDTVLVYPGRYYENIRFYGKNITLASLDLTTGILDYKYSTILDGSSNGPVVVVKDNESNVTIRGFSITNGSGTYADVYDTTVGGGINISRLSGQRICNIINCLVYGNNADLGGGVRVSAGNLTLSGVSIVNNFGKSGGGLVFQGGYSMNFSIFFDPVNRCNIYNNKAAFGCEMYFYLVDQVHVVVDTFTVATPSNFYASAVPASSNIENPYTFDILHSVHTETNHDLYVSTWGDDTNSGLSAGYPLKTIFQAVYNIASDADNPKTIHLADGYYSASQNQQFFPVPMKSYTRLEGNSRENVVLDIEMQASGMSISPYSKNLSAAKFTIRNCKGGIGASHSEGIELRDITIENIQYIQSTSAYAGSENINLSLNNVKISNAYTGSVTYGINMSLRNGYFSAKNIEISNLRSQETVWPFRIDAKGVSEAIIDGLVIHDNLNPSPDMYNGIFQIAPYDGYCQRFRVELSNSSFYNNHQNIPNHLAYIYALNDTAFVRNCTFAGNTGGSSALIVQGNAVFTNNVFWNPSLAREIDLFYSTDSGVAGRAEFSYNNIRNGLNGVYNYSTLNQLIWAEGNTAEDPLFANDVSHPYRLSALSPLIDAGWQYGSGLAEPQTDAGGNERLWDGDGDGLARIDIGAYEYQPIFAPQNLIATVWQQQISLAWDMPVLDRSLVGYRIYRNNVAIGEVSDLSRLFYRDHVSVSDTLTYYVVALYGSVESAPSNEVTVIVQGVANEDELQTPMLPELSIAPNPFTDIAVVQYQLKESAQVQLRIYNLKGQLVRSLEDDTLAKGEHITAWEGCDNNGRHVGAGIYFLRTMVDDKQLCIRKLVKL